MTKYPHVPAAFINAIAEEGTKDEAVDWLQKQWNENCALRAEIAALRGVAPAARNDIGILLSELRQFEEAVGETFDDEGGDIAAIERDYKASSVSSPSPPMLNPSPLEAAKKLLIKASVGSCTCNTKSPELMWHRLDCRYVALMTALENVESVESALSLVSSPHGEPQS